MSPVFTVGQLTSYLRALIEGDEVMQNVLVQGEVSNCRLHSSGHLYFTLKDKTSCLRAVMFRNRAQALLFKPVDGVQVLAQGYVSVYERDGQYQIIVNSLQPSGLGSLYLAYEQLKQKLQAEGLFAAERKQALPLFPRTIGIATSPTGAAIRDLISIIQRRYPKVKVYLVPVAVQGPEAPESIKKGLEILGQLPEVDLIIVGRGGGSREELWAFNDEGVARAIAACPKPIISAVGHESDFTIVDFVADKRAATPSAAAELAVPVLQDVERTIESLLCRLVQAERTLLKRLRRDLAAYSERRVLQTPVEVLRPHYQTVDVLEQRLKQAVQGRLQESTGKFAAIAARLEAMSPLAVLGRGYSITQGNDQRIVKSIDQISKGEILETILTDGRVYSQVQDVRGRENDQKSGE